MLLVSVFENHSNYLNQDSGNQCQTHNDTELCQRQGRSGKQMAQEGNQQHQEQHTTPMPKAPKLAGLLRKPI